MNNKRVANFLGWFSIGLGAAEIIVPRRLGRVSGVGDRHPWLTRVFGMREIASGIGILTMRRKAPWLWARVAGDALDVTAMSLALGSRGSKPGRIAASAAAVAPIVAMDVLLAQAMTNNRERWAA